MRKITLLLGCFIGLSGAITAQDLQQTSEIDGLLNRLSQIGNSTGDVSDYFSQAEQRALHTYFNINKYAPTSATVNYSKPFGASNFNDFVSNNETQTIQLLPKTATNVSLGAQQATMALTTYTDRPTFEGDYPHTLVSEDFSGGPGAGQIVTCGTLVSSAGDGCFAAGVLEAGFSIEASNTTDVIYLGSGAIGNTSTLMGANTFLEYTIVNFDGAYAIGFDLWVDGVSNGEIRVYDTAGVPIGSYILTNTPSTENFFGIISDDVAIGSIEIQAELDAGELFGNLAFGNDPLGGGGGPAVAFGVNNTTTSLVSWDPADPTVLTNLGISPAPDFENAGAIDPADNGTAYVLDNSGNFYSVDLASGAYTSLGNIVAPNGESWAGAEFDPTSGTLYAISTNVTTSTLSSIDIAAATATTVGMTSMAGAISLMIDAAGSAYSHDIVDDTFYSIDLVTGASTPIGPLLFDANFGQGGTYNAGDGMVYLSAFDGGAFQSQWRQVDVTTGASTVIGLFNGGADQVAWSSIQGGTVGISENALEGFAFYPNPTSDVLSLKSVNNIDSVTLYNLLGQSVLNANIDATTSEINLSGLTTGTYIMKVSVDGQIGSYKVLKN